MKTPSRKISPLTERTTSPVAYVISSILALVLIYLCYISKVLLLFVAVVFVGCLVSTILHRKKLRNIAKDRHDEGICNFARSFDCSLVDTSILRATYEELQKHLKSDFPDFPIQKTDSLEDLLQMEFEDIYEIISDIAQRAGYSMDEAVSNPLFDKLNSIEDLVMFLNSQPKYGSSQPGRCT